MRKKILAITGIRSEYDIVYPVINTLRKDKNFEVKIVVCGAHLSDWHGFTLKKIEEDGFEIADKIDYLLMTDRKTQRAKGAGMLTYALSQTVERENPDLLLVVGDIAPEEIFETAEARLGSLKRGSTTPSQDLVSTPKTSDRVVQIIHRSDLTQSQIRMGHPCIQRTSPDHDVFQVANYVLGGGGFSSRLMEKIRSQKGYTYGISSHFKGRVQPGPFVISTFTPNENVAAVVGDVLEVLDTFVVEGPTPKELEEAKNFYLGSFPFRFETLPKIAREMLEMERYGLGRECLTEYPQRISQMTQTEVQRVAQHRIVPEGLRVVIVGNAASFSESMHTFGAVETVDFRTLLDGQP